MIGAPVRSAADTKPPRPNRWSLYRSLNGLPTPLKPSGQTPTARRWTAAARRRGWRPASTRLAGDLTDHRRLEDQVGAEHPQVPVPGCSSWTATWVISESIATCPSGWRRPGRRRSPGCSRCRAPRPGTTSGRAVAARQVEVPGEVLVEAELVDRVVAGDPASQERQHRREVALDVVGRDARRLGRHPDRGDAGRRQLLHPGGDAARARRGARPVSTASGSTRSSVTALSARPPGRGMPRGRRRRGARPGGPGRAGAGARHRLARRDGLGDRARTVLATARGSAAPRASAATGVTGVVVLGRRSGGSWSVLSSRLPARPVPRR